MGPLQMRKIRRFI